jgi:hypothetical protein
MALYSRKKDLILYDTMQTTDKQGMDNEWKIISIFLGDNLFL